METFESAKFTIEGSNPFIIVQNDNIVYANYQFKNLLQTLNIPLVPFNMAWNTIFPEEKIDKNDFQTSIADNFITQKDIKFIGGTTFKAISRMIYWDQSIAFLVFFKKSQ